MCPVPSNVSGCHQNVSGYHQHVSGYQTKNQNYLNCQNEKKKPVFSLCQFEIICFIHFQTR